MHPAYAATMAEAEAIVLFDGVCNLCNGVVRWLIRHDRREALRFASLQSDVGLRLAARHGLAGVESIVVVEGERAFVRSDAVLRLTRHLARPWSLLGAARVLPRPLRDLGYRALARSRYRIFGRRDECMVPTPELQARFLA